MKAPPTNMQRSQSAAADTAAPSKEQQLEAYVEQHLRREHYAVGPHLKQIRAEQEQMGARQKTVDIKTQCCCMGRRDQAGGPRRGLWCGGCLMARMGENIEEVLRQPDWRCPACRGICNCSAHNCQRARRGLRVTDQLVHEATSLGFKSEASAALAERGIGMSILDTDMYDQGDDELLQQDPNTASKGLMDVLAEPLRALHMQHQQLWQQQDEQQQMQPRIANLLAQRDVSAMLGMVAKPAAAAVAVAGFSGRGAVGTGTAHAADMEALDDDFGPADVPGADAPGYHSNAELMHSPQPRHRPLSVPSVALHGPANLHGMLRPNGLHPGFRNVPCRQPKLTSWLSKAANKARPPRATVADSAAAEAPAAGSLAAAEEAADHTTSLRRYLRHLCHAETPLVYHTRSRAADPEGELTLEEQLGRSAALQRSQQLLQQKCSKILNQAFTNNSMWDDGDVTINCYSDSPCKYTHDTLCTAAELLLLLGRLLPLDMEGSSEGAGGSVLDVIRRLRGLDAFLNFQASDPQARSIIIMKTLTLLDVLNQRASADTIMAAAEAAAASAAGAGASPPEAAAAAIKAARSALQDAGHAVRGMCDLCEQLLDWLGLLRVELVQLYDWLRSPKDLLGPLHIGPLKWSSARSEAQQASASFLHRQQQQQQQLEQQATIEERCLRLKGLVDMDGTIITLCCKHLGAAAAFLPKAVALGLLQHKELAALLALDLPLLEEVSHELQTIANTKLQQWQQDHCLKLKTSKAETLAVVYGLQLQAGCVTWQQMEQQLTAPAGSLDRLLLHYKSPMLRKLVLYVGTRMVLWHATKVLSSNAATMSLFSGLPLTIDVAQQLSVPHHCGIVCATMLRVVCRRVAAAGGPQRLLELLRGLDQALRMREAELDSQYQRQQLLTWQYNSIRGLMGTAEIISLSSSVVAEQEQLQSDEAALEILQHVKMLLSVSGLPGAAEAGDQHQRQPPDSCLYQSAGLLHQLLGTHLRLVLETSADMGLPATHTRAVNALHLVKALFDQPHLQQPKSLQLLLPCLARPLGAIAATSFNITADKGGRRRGSSWWCRSHHIQSPVSEQQLQRLMENLLRAGLQTSLSAVAGPPPEVPASLKHWAAQGWPATRPATPGAAGPAASALGEQLKGPTASMTAAAVHAGAARPDDFCNLLAVAAVGFCKRMAQLGGFAQEQDQGSDHQQRRPCTDTAGQHLATPKVLPRKLPQQPAAGSREVVGLVVNCKKINSTDILAYKLELRVRDGSHVQLALSDGWANRACQLESCGQLRKGAVVGITGVQQSEVNHKIYLFSSKSVMCVAGKCWTSDGAQLSPAGATSAASLADCAADLLGLVQEHAAFVLQHKQQHRQHSHHVQQGQEQQAGAKSQLQTKQPPNHSELGEDQVTRPAAGRLGPGSQGTSGDVRVDDVGRSVLSEIQSDQLETVVAAASASACVGAQRQSQAVLAASSMLQDSQATIKYLTLPGMH
eukprot:gene6218-6455_t